MDGGDDWKVVETHKKVVKVAAPPSSSFGKNFQRGKSWKNDDERLQPSRWPTTIVQKGNANPSTYSKIFYGSEKDKSSNPVAVEPEEPKVQLHQSEYENDFPTPLVHPPRPVTKTNVSKPLEIKKKEVSDQPEVKKSTALFDVLLTSLTDKTHKQTTVNSRNNKLSSEKKIHPSNKLHSNALRNLETVFEPKKFVVSTIPIAAIEKKKKKKQKKRLTTLKKKILRERVRMHLQRQIQIKLEKQRKLQLQQQSLQKQHTTTQTASSTSSSMPTSIRIYNFANDIDWKDESEKDEIIVNIKDILTMLYDNDQHTLPSFLPTQNTAPISSTTVFNYISSMSVWKLKDGAFPAHSNKSEKEMDDETDEESEDQSTITYIDIKFKQSEIAQLYLQVLNEMVIGGETLHVTYGHLDNGEYTKQQLQHKLLASSPPSQSVQVMQNQTDSALLVDNDKGSVVITVMLENVVQEEEEIQESDDVNEILHDIYSLCESLEEDDLKKGSIPSFTPRSLWMEKTIINPHKNIKQHGTLPHLPVAMIKLKSWKDALRINEKMITYSASSSSSFPGVSWYDTMIVPALNDSPSALPIIPSSGIITLPYNAMSSAHNTNTVPDIITDHRSSYFGIGFLGFVSSDEYEDEDERQEIIDNLQTLFHSTPELTDLSSLMIIEQIIFARYPYAHSNDNGESYSLYVIVSGLSLQRLFMIYDHLTSVIISGQSLLVELISIPSLFSAINDTAEQVADEEEGDEVEKGISVICLDDGDDDVFRKSTSLLLDQYGSQTIIIPLLPSETQLLSLSSTNHEQVTHLKQRIMARLLFSAHDQNEEEKNVQSILSLQQFSLFYLDNCVSDSSMTFTGESVVYRICLQFDAWSRAVMMLNYFDGLLLGGSRVTATMTTSYSNTNNHNNNSNNNNNDNDRGSDRKILLEYDITAISAPEQSSNIEEAEEEIGRGEVGMIDLAFSQNHWQSFFECVYFEFFFQPTPSPPPPPTIPTTLPSPSLQTSTTISNINDNDKEMAEKEDSEGNNNKPNNTDNKRKKKETTEKEEKEYDLGGLQDEDLNNVQPGKTIYKVAKALPKIGNHDEPLDPTLPMANEEINLIIKEFLTSLSNFQIKLKEENPLKWKAKTRYLVGMKQVLQQVKKTVAFPHQIALRCKLVLLAPNTERNEELDNKLSEVIALAKQAEIPVIYCLSKRLLGKALQMTIKQSIVGIMDPSGVYDLFKKILHFIDSYIPNNTK